MTIWQFQTDLWEIGSPNKEKEEELLSRAPPMVSRHPISLEENISLIGEMKKEKKNTM